MVKLEQVLTEFPFIGNDPIYAPVKIVIEQRKKLIEFKSQASGFIIPIVDSEGKLEPRFDPDRLEEVKTLAYNIEITRKSIGFLEDKISQIEAFAEKHGLERPSIREIRDEINTHRAMMETARKEPGVVLGNILTLQEHDIEKANQRLDYKEAVKRSEQAKVAHELQIAKLEKALMDLEGVLSVDVGAA